MAKGRAGKGVAGSGSREVGPHSPTSVYDILPDHQTLQVEHVDRSHVQSIFMKYDDQSSVLEKVLQGRALHVCKLEISTFLYARQIFMDENTVEMMSLFKDVYMEAKDMGKRYEVEDKGRRLANLQGAITRFGNNDWDKSTARFNFMSSFLKADLKNSLFEPLIKIAEQHDNKAAIYVDVLATDIMGMPSDVDLGDRPKRVPKPKDLTMSSITGDESSSDDDGDSGDDNGDNANKGTLADKGSYGRSNCQTTPRRVTSVPTAHDLHSLPTPSDGFEEMDLSAFFQQHDPHFNTGPTGIDYAVPDFSKLPEELDPYAVGGQEGFRRVHALLDPLFNTEPLVMTPESSYDMGGEEAEERSLELIPQQQDFEQPGTVTISDLEFSELHDSGVEEREKESEDDEGHFDPENDVELVSGMQADAEVDGDLEVELGADYKQFTGRVDRLWRRQEEIGTVRHRNVLGHDDLEALPADDIYGYGLIEMIKEDDVEVDDIPKNVSPQVEDSGSRTVKRSREESPLDDQAPLKKRCDPAYSADDEEDQIESSRGSSAHSEYDLNDGQDNHVMLDRPVMVKKKSKRGLWHYVKSLFKRNKAPSTSTTVGGRAQKRRSSTELREESDASALKRLCEYSSSFTEPSLIHGLDVTILRGHFFGFDGFYSDIPDPLSVGPGQSTLVVSEASFHTESDDVEISPQSFYRDVSMSESLAASFDREMGVIDTVEYLLSRVTYAVEESVYEPPSASFMDRVNREWMLGDGNITPQTFQREVGDRLRANLDTSDPFEFIGEGMASDLNKEKQK